MNLQPGNILAAVLVVVSVGFGCQSERAPTGVSEDCTLTAASNMRHPPFSSWDAQQTAVGIEVEIVNTAAAEIGCRVEWVEKPFSELLTAIEDTSVDIAVSTIGITTEREQRVAFSQPYFATQIVALVRPNSEINSDQATTSFSAAPSWCQTPVPALSPKIAPDTPTPGAPMAETEPSGRKITPRRSWVF